MNNIISIDETSIDSHISHNYGWSISGKKIIITNTHPRIRYSVIAAISRNKVIHYKIIKGSVKGEIFFFTLYERINEQIKKQKYISYNIR